MSDSFTVGVTGGAGYIGTCVIKELQASHPDWDVVAIDNFYEGTTRSVGDVTIEHVDIRNRDRLEETLGDVDVICHLAAVSGVDDCDENPELSYEVNVVGTNHVGKLCQKHGIGLIFPASMAILGDPTDFPITLDQPREALNWYAKTKILGEAAIEQFARDTFPAHILVKSNLYGGYDVEGEFKTKPTVINFFLDRAESGSTLTVYEPGTQSRNFIHVVDVARAYVKSIERLRAELADDETGVSHYPVASDEDPSVEAVANLVKSIASEVGLDVDVELVENPRSGETMVDRFDVDTSQTRSELGWEPTRTVEATIREQLDASADAS